MNTPTGVLRGLVTRRVITALIGGSKRPCILIVFSMIITVIKEKKYHPVSNYSIYIAAVFFMGFPDPTKLWA
ncbi:hypothetical protein [Dysgonomonas sp.]